MANLKKKKWKTNQLQLCFNGERIQNNSRPNNSELFEAMIGLINIEYFLSDITNAFHHRSDFGDDDKKLILTHFWVQLANLLSEFQLLNKFLILFAHSPGIDVMDFMYEFEEARKKLQEAVI